MKKTILISFILLNFTQNVFCAIYDELAVVRGKKGKLVEKIVSLKHLKINKCLSGEFFKIVLKKEDTPICFDFTDKKILLKAVTTYHHLTIAREYFVNNFNPASIEKMNQITIRIEIDNQFNEIGHFANDNAQKEYNNALSIPIGEAKPDWGIKGWGHEIWFRPSKNVKVPIDLGGMQNFVPGLAGLKNKGFKNFIPAVLTALAYAYRFNGYSTNGMDYSGVFDVVRSMAIMDLTFWGIKGTIKIAGNKKVSLSLDSAFIPEIIYHEYAHLALSDHLELSHSTPVNEGMADYFAAAIAKSPHLAKKIKKYSNANGKNGNNKSLYNSAYELTQFASIDFVLGVFWKIRLALPNKADELIYKASARLNSESNIRENLLRAILLECRITCKDPLTDRYKLLEVFQKKGF